MIEAAAPLSGLSGLPERGRTSRHTAATDTGASIGPNRRRCLDKMRRHPAIAALIRAEDATA